MSIAPLPASEGPAAPGREHGDDPPRTGIPVPRTATLTEIFAGDGRDAGAIGFALAQARGDKPLLWVQDRMSILETGRPFPGGLILRDFIHIEARDAKQALWAMEEGLRCGVLGAVIGEIWGNPLALDFTATRRLAVAAETHGVPATLILFGSRPNLSGARLRWRVESRASPPHPHDDRAPGIPAWSLDLFRARGFQLGRWEAAYDAHAGSSGKKDGKADRLHLLSPLRNGELAAAEPAELLNLTA